MLTLWVNSMSQYKIEKRTKYDTDGSIISTVWDVYHEDGRLAEEGIDSKEKAQIKMEVLELNDALKITAIPLNDSKPKSNG